MTAVSKSPGNVSVALTGEALLRSSDGAEHRLERKDAGLLAYLALNGPTPRARAAAILWPDVSEEKARTNLRQRLSRLRKAAGEIVNERNTVLSLHPRVLVDVGQQSNADRLLATRQLLETHSYDDCSEFSQWLEMQREAQWRERRATFRAQLQSTKERDMDAALQVANEWLRLEPDSEEAHREFAEVLYLRGEVEAAKDALARCVDMLRRAYGAAPNPQTEKLARQVHLASQNARERLSPRRFPASVLRPPRLVGRQSAWATARDALTKNRTVVIAGDAGIGKSRLIEELLLAEVRRSVRFRCRPDDALQPRSAIARCMTQLRSDCSPALDEATLREIARLVPAYGPAPEPMTSAIEVSVLHAAICRYLDACHEASGGLVIAFDDLHFADAASVEALKVCLRPDLAAAGKAPSFVLATRLQGGSWQAKDLLKVLEASDDVDALVLEPLNCADTIEIIADLELDEPKWKRMAEQLHVHSGGNPAVLLETIKALIRREPASASGTGLPIPASVQAALRERLATLTPMALAVVQLAAVAGEAFSLDLAQRALGQPRIALAPAMRELSAAQILHEGGFVHDLLREAVLEELPRARAETLHLHAAEFLQQAGAAPALIARHLISARDEPSALPHLHAAAQVALDELRPDECARLQEEIARIELARGDRHAAVVALAESFSMYMATSFVEDANRIFAQWGELAESPRERLILHAERARQQAGFEYLDIAMQHAAEAIQLLEANKDFEADLVAEAFVAVCPALTLSGRALQAKELADRLAPRIPAMSPAARLAFLKGQGSALHGINRHQEAVGALRKAVGIHETGIELIQEWETRMRLANYLVGAGRFADAKCEAQQSIEVGQRQPHFPTHTSTAHFVKAIALFALGEYAEARTYLVARRDYFRRTGWRSDARVASRLALLHLSLGAPAEAWEDLRDVDMGRVGPQDVALVELARAQVARAQGRSPKPHLEAVLAAHGICSTSPPILRARLLAAQDTETTGALRESRAVMELARSEGWVTLVHAAALMGAKAALRSGDTTSAIELVEIALGHDDCCDAEIGYPPEVWGVGHRVYSAAGRSALAAKHLRRAADWLTAVLQAHIPENYRQSFVRENPVNRSILAAVSAVRRRRA
jgi:DNA-binding SARP family transcriptional activator